MTIDHFPTPMIIAHRGASAYSPENTLPAFILAGEQGAHGIELDVKLTGDGEVVVLHDQSVDRTTNGQGDLRSFTINQLKKLDAGSKFSEEFSNTRIPTLREVFETVSKTLFINIELTNYASPQDDLVARVISLVRQFGQLDRILFSSFNPFALYKAKSLCPEIPNGLLIMPTGSFWFANNIFAPLLHCMALHPFHADTRKSMIDSAHKKGRRVHVWTVNSDIEMQRLCQDAADAIFTDDPILARSNFCPNK